MNSLFLFDNDFETESKHHRKTAVVINSSYLEFTRCCSSEYVFSYKVYGSFVQVPLVIVDGL